jgi:hypothetical protein
MDLFKDWRVLGGLAVLVVLLLAMMYCPLFQSAQAAAKCNCGPACVCGLDCDCCPECRSCADGCPCRATPCPDCP